MTQPRHDAIEVGLSGLGKGAIGNRLCHGIIFQQLSIVAAAAIMHRFVERFSTPVVSGNVRLYPFPRPEGIAAARENSLRAVGLSTMKALYLKAEAKGILSGDVFPPTDSGASRNIKTLSANPRIDSDEVLAALGGTRGMLYFHLLLGGLHGMLPQ